LNGTDLRGGQGRNESEIGQFDARGGPWLGGVIDCERRHITHAEFIDRTIMVAINPVTYQFHSLHAEFVMGRVKIEGPNKTKYSLPLEGADNEVCCDPLHL